MSGADPESVMSVAFIPFGGEGGYPVFFTNIRPGRPPPPPPPPPISPPPPYQTQTPPPSPSPTYPTYKTQQ